MLKVSILGCGWLGLPLAAKMAANGMAVKGSTTSENKLEIFRKEGIEPFRIVLHENEVEGNITQFLADSDILIIDVPPKAKSGENFAEKIQVLIPHIEASGIGNLLFVSSTSVYADDNLDVTENTIPNPDTESGRQLVESERILQQNTHFKTTILRFGGLISEDRHPVHHLAGRENLANPDGPVNLIHRDDCMGIILKLIEKEAWGEVFNAAAPYHPTRKDYYTQKAMELGLAVPQFAVDEDSKGKVVSSEKVKGDLGYEFMMGI